MMDEFSHGKAPRWSLVFAVAVALGLAPDQLVTVCAPGVFVHEGDNLLDHPSRIHERLHDRHGRVSLDNSLVRFASLGSAFDA